ncbi:MAG: hypothetical protein WA628_01455 [Terriglobales bacterium]
MKKLTFVSVGLMLSWAAAASGQQMDFAFGLSTTHAAPASTTSTLLFPPVSLTGGLYPSISGDFLIKKNVGVGGEISWRGGQANYDFSQPYRPIFWDFDGIYMPKLGPRVAAELSAGIGAESTRFYTNYVTCSFVSCTNYATSTHFMGQFGAGLKLYARGGLFVRPEVHLYVVNNNVEYTSPYVVRYGASIGYTFGGR